MPEKAARLLIEDDPELEFELFLCQKLGWRSLAAMRDGMPNSEFVLWSRYFDKQQQEQELAALKTGG